jgi:hypothetical protein
MKRFGIPLLTLILSVLILAGGCTLPEDETAPVVPFFPDRHGFDLKQLTITDGEAALAFKRVDCVWVIGNTSAPADEPRVSALAEAFVTLAPHLEPALGPERFADFKVAEDDFTRKAILTFKDNSTYTLFIGIPALTKPAYIRSANANQVYSADEPLLHVINLDGSSWHAPRGD